MRVTVGTSNTFPMRTYLWRHYPLSIHERAQEASEAAECAGRQGKFWQFHDRLFERQSELGEADLLAAAQELGLDLEAFGTCLAGGTTTAKIEADVAIGNDLSVSGTPTWFLGVVQPDGKVRVTHRFLGPGSFASFEEAIDEALETVNGLGK